MHELENRTFKLLAALGEQSPAWNGPLTDAMLDSAKPPPYRARADKYVRIYPDHLNRAQATAGAGEGHGTLQHMANMPPLDDADLQPAPGSRLPETNFGSSTHAPLAAANSVQVPSVARVPINSLPNYDEMQRETQRRERDGAYRQATR